jgi:hypothetical protein
VVVPSQYAANSNVATTGTERLYSQMLFEVYHAPASDTDYNMPVITQLTTTNQAASITFDVGVVDDSNTVSRVVVLYRALTATTWSKVELAYASGHASATVPGVNGSIEFVVQAVDPSGNVALSLDSGGKAYVQAAGTNMVYLPLIRR